METSADEDFCIAASYGLLLLLLPAACSPLHRPSTGHVSKVKLRIQNTEQTMRDVLSHQYLGDTDRVVTTIPN